MPYDYSRSLNPEKALIFRIVHRDNLPWILTHGLWAGNATEQSDSWVHIGLAELISKRAHHPVPLAPFGCIERLRAILFHSLFSHAQQYPLREGRAAAQ
ncbi:DarT ssDNA thymidine ADP-ribosyltransferase family protein [Aeromonas caviae]|uniref:DarT ssDNA thymidine ADP-ribosyltransferase family protein n=1 Tax=Aeromonas caviae TaxID=648 RepID=UPI002B4A13DC|nr:DarT ssDNA thymidine ADP-ribosyltransferase family protein [Aeromonas caviae]